MTVQVFQVVLAVHCRTGSLEKFYAVEVSVLLVHCRTGSLEKSSGNDCVFH